MKARTDFQRSPRRPISRSNKPIWPPSPFGTAAIASRTLEVQRLLSNLGTKWSADWSGWNHCFTSSFDFQKYCKMLWLHLFKTMAVFQKHDISRDHWFFKTKNGKVDWMTFLYMFCFFAPSPTLCKLCTGSDTISLTKGMYYVRTNICGKCVLGHTDGYKCIWETCDG